MELLEQLDYDFSALERTSGSLMQTFGAMEAAMRQSDLAWEVRDYLADHPQAAVVNLGCGLDQTGRSCDNGQCRLYNIDLPDVMAVREALLPAGEREKNLTADLNDLSWFDAIDTPLKMELCSLPPGCSITSEQNRCKPSARLWRSDFQVDGWYLTPPDRRQ